jgi:hypothetical protein
MMIATLRAKNLWDILSRAKVIMESSINIINAIKNKEDENR